MPLIEKTTEVEQLFEHSKEFIKKFILMRTASCCGWLWDRQLHLIEGDGFNIIIDATDSVFQVSLQRVQSNQQQSYSSNCLHS